MMKEKFGFIEIFATYSMVEAGLGISMNNRINSFLWNGTVKHLPLEPNQPMDIGLAYKKYRPGSSKILRIFKK